MSVARTYFFNRMAGDELARLCDAKADFFLENVDDLELAVTRLHALCRDAGMSSAVVRAPLNPAPGIGDLVSAAVPLLGLIWTAKTVGSAVHPQADVSLRLTSNTSISVVFSDSARVPTLR
ncbi:hypothetical protein [Achromobacter sp. ACRQX]|uniref:hypothetical protein n=1 Tax=Achromobacter sp. ACRQX TaxID=2918181 RepID=UPI001EF22E2C|nr:hypothetical protein [Achromobacter sp. ACRQX]MCG7328129.1 hypothetical protein [Achromobacter sp. ACRQX]